MKKKKLGEVLRDRGHISQANLALAVADQQGKIIHLGELMLERGLVSKVQLASAISELTRVPYVDCSTTIPSANALRLVPKALAIKCTALPIAVEDSKLILVMAEPQDLNIADEIRFKAGKNVSPRMGFRKDIVEAIEKYYGGGDPDAEKAATRIAGETEETVSAEEAAGPLDIEFVSTSSRLANRESIQEVQAELLHSAPPR